MKIISLRVNDDELEAMERAAASERMKLGTWIKRSALIEADRIKSQPLPAIQAQSAATTPPLMP